MSWPDVPLETVSDDGDRTWRTCEEAPWECDVTDEQENPDAPVIRVCAVHKVKR